MIHYLLQTIVFQLFFLLIYDVFLRNETFFNWNRAYLLTTSALSLILPFIKIKQIQTMVPQDMVVRLPEVILGDIQPSQPSAEIALQAGIVIDNQPDVTWWQIALMVGSIVTAIIFISKIVRILWLRSKNPKRWKRNVLLVRLLNSKSAFSFFNTIFLGSEISEKEQATIIAHEMVHVRECHSADLLFFEMLRILFWFNPLVYMYQTRMSILHEYIADAKAVKQNKRAYYESLLSQVFETKHLSFVNPFFKKSLLKKRIAMLTRTKSKQFNLLKYVLALPFLVGFLIYTSSYASPYEKLVVENNFLISQDITGQELQAKYYDEIEKQISEGQDFLEVYKAYIKTSDTYLQTKDDYYKTRALLEYMSETKKKKTKDNSQPYVAFKSYETYLEEKKTLQSKQDWENLARDGDLRLVVENLSELTPEEEKRKQKKLAMIEKDNFFKRLVITDGFSSTLVQAEDNKTVVHEKLIIESQDDVEVIELDLEVPFAIIEEPPHHESCKSLSRNEKQDCMRDFINSFVNQNFNKDLPKKLGLSGRQRINVIFKIDTEGKVTSVKSRAGHPGLEEEAERVINSLPQFEPGKQKGKPVVVPYSLPIVFQVAENTNKDAGTDTEDTSSEHLKELREKYKDELGEVPFAVVDEAPTFADCKDKDSENARRFCVSQKISYYVSDNFNRKIAKENNLEGMQRINVIFKIGKDGKIFGVQSRAPHPALEAEAIRVIESLPQFEPGTQRGKPVVVPYSLPIVFKVD